MVTKRTVTGVAVGKFPCGDLCGREAHQAHRLPRCLLPCFTIRRQALPGGRVFTVRLLANPRAAGHVARLENLLRIPRAGILERRSCLERGQAIRKIAKPSAIARSANWRQAPIASDMVICRSPPCTCAPFTDVLLVLRTAPAIVSVTARREAACSRFCIAIASQASRRA